MRTLLAGNGINIQFGGKAYTSEFIIDRMRCNATLEKYDPLFEDTISGRELVQLFDSFVSLVERILNGECDEAVTDEYLKIALDDFKHRYRDMTISYPRDILLEDWLFVLKMYHVLYDNDPNAENATAVAFKRLFLDAIYNDGGIQNIYKKMGRKVVKFFKSFDDIYTVNYDSNLESVTSKPVFHLHGEFTELQAAVNPEYAMGYLNLQKGESVLIPSFEHCFCNALLDYSSDKKYAEAVTMHRANIGVDNYLNEKIDEFPSDQKEIILTHKLNPQLKLAPEYYFEDFESISDELCIIGLSPNNDQHILNMVRRNNKITLVKFYCYSDKEKETVEKMGDSRFEICDVIELWDKLGVEKQKNIT